MSDHRDQALIVWRHGDDTETAQLVRMVSAEALSEAPVERRTAAAPD